jgi:DNA-binding XRE family transcriptional regulator
MAAASWKASGPPGYGEKMSEQRKKQPPAFVVIEGELYWEFDRWRKMQGYVTSQIEETDGWMIYLHRKPEAVDDVRPEPPVEQPQAGPLINALMAMRVEKLLAQQEIAAQCGVDQSTISRLESGQIKEPTWALLAGYANAVGVAIDSLGNIVKRPTDRS